MRICKLCGEVKTDSDEIKHDSRICLYAWAYSLARNMILEEYATTTSFKKTEKKDSITAPQKK